jgi:1,4-alpha-glucan branching enzyme
MLTPQARRAQIRVATVNHRKHFGADPKGIWLAECGYVPGIEDLLRDVGIRYFFVDTHGIYYGAPRPRLGVYHHVYTPSGVAAFGRDVETSRSVWSAEAGYPGHGDYREFYRDLGYDGGYDYVRRFLHPDGVRRNLGLKYHRITGKVNLHQKQAYQPDVAFRLAMDHAGDFCAKRIAQCKHLEGLLGRPPLITAPYDAELFGHWWYEGPQFIESIFRCLHSLGNPIRPVTGSEYLASEPIAQIVTPAASSWGDAGYNGVWLNPGNDWIYRHLHAAETRMVEAARTNPDATGLRRAVLDQMARELLLAQSSDWAFIMTTGTTVPYAVRRTKDHINRFTGLWESLQENRMDAGMVERIRWSDPIFEEIDYRVFA